MIDRFAERQKTASLKDKRPVTISVLCLLSIVLWLAGCREYKVSDDPSMRLTFSCDTLSFDTVFTAQGSATAQIMVYNPNKNAMIIDRVWLNHGKAFRANVDGEADLSRLTNLQINGGDSLYVFIRADIDPTNKNNPVIVTDTLHFHLANGNTQGVALEAFGQDIVRIGYKGCKRTDRATALTLTADKPYLIYDTLMLQDRLTIRAGATIYMHKGACIYALGRVIARGTADKPIVIRSDRTDRLFEHVPYLYASGGWNGIYLVTDLSLSYQMEYVDILSGNIGLYCISNRQVALPHLTMKGCRIHNHALYGLVLINTDAEVSDTEISNCASYCVYCAGGTHEFTHTTVASYFGATDIRIQSVAKEATAAVYIDNLSKNAPETKTSFYNSIITGYQANQLVVATPFDRYYTGEFVGNYLKTDTVRVPHAHDNCYWQSSDKRPMFRNTYYKYKEYVYYDFHLDSLSPARAIGDSLIALTDSIDRDGHSRAFTRPDAGCYQYLP